MTETDLLRRWKTQICRLSHEHALSARFYEKLHWRLGLPVVGLTAVVGASIFGALQESPSVEVQIGVGCLSLLTLVLSSVQTFLGLDDRAAKHKAASAGFQELAREAQGVSVCGVAEGTLKAYLSDLRTRWDAVAREAPTLRQSRIEKFEEAFGLAGED